jgi:DNA-binding PadR family transcriptional regulator
VEHRLRDVWTSVQRAETLLIQAAVHQNPVLRTQLYDGFDLDETARQLLARMACGFDPQNLTARDYLVRHPFSSVEAIQAGLDHLVEGGVAAAKGEGRYAVTELGERVVRRWMEKVSFMIQSLYLGDVPSAAAQRLLDYDRRIVEAIQAASRPPGHPIFGHRLRGLHPAYDPPQLWHHWQWVWTMLAASKDEEEYVRQRRGVEPMVWFARRQIWFNHRRPWRARVRTLDDLVRRATGYSPVDRAEAVCRQAIRTLEDRGWVATVDGEYRLTPEGLALCDEDEREIDGYFLSCWPDLSEDQFQDLLYITTRLNNRCEELSRPEPEGTEG